MRNVRVTIWVMVVVFFVGKCFGGYWNVQYIGTADAGYDHHGLAIDNNGTPHISYDSNYAYRDESGNWVTSIFEPDSVDPGRSSIAINSEGNPSILYTTRVTVGGPVELRYAKKNGSVWEIETVSNYDDTISMYTQSLVLDEFDNPLAVYKTGDNLQNLMFAVRNPGSYGVNWSVVGLEVSEYATVGMPSFALDNDGMPHVIYEYAYEDQDTYEYIESIRHKFVDGEWATEDIVSGPVDYNRGQMGFDSQNTLHLAYTDDNPENRHTIHAFGNNGDWEYEDIDMYGTTDAVLVDQDDGLHFLGRYDYVFFDGENWFDREHFRGVASGHFGQIQGYVLNGNNPSFLITRANPGELYFVEYIPEPATLLLLGLGGLMVRRKK